MNIAWNIFPARFARALNELFYKFLFLKVEMRRRQCVMFHSHSIAFLINCFSDCPKLRECHHFSVAYNRSAILSCRSQLRCISLLLCTNVAFLFFALLVYKLDVFSYPFLHGRLAILESSTISFFKSFIGASFITACTHSMLSTDRRFSVKCSTKRNIVVPIPDGW